MKHIFAIVIISLWIYFVYSNNSTAESKTYIEIITNMDSKGTDWPNDLP